MGSFRAAAARMNRKVGIERRMNAHSQPMEAAISPAMIPATPAMGLAKRWMRKTLG
jgi:hypothetical protein